jgi:hypothetical protein
VLFFYLLPVQMACVAVAWASYDGVRLPLRFYASVAVLCVMGASVYQSGVLGRGIGDNRLIRGTQVDFLSPSWSCFIDRCSQTRAEAEWLVPSNPGPPTLAEALQRAEASPRDLASANDRTKKHGWPGLPRLWLGQILGAVVGACLGGMCAFIRGLLGRQVAARDRLWSGEAPLVLALAGLVGGWYLPLAIASLWLIERGLSGTWAGIRTAVRSQGTPGLRATAEWFLLPWYFWVAVAAWRWFP